MGIGVASLSRRSTRRWAGLAATTAALLVGAAVISWFIGQDNGGPAPARGATALATRTVPAGEVTVKVEPRQVDATGAVFKVTFDTHSEALDLDVARGATLVVGGVAWPVAGWSGDGPGGHHREGELRFSAGGPATGAAMLTISGLSKPVTATWDAGG